MTPVYALRIFVCAGLVGFSCAALGARHGASRKPTQVEPAPISVSVVIGDRKTVFAIDKAPAGAAKPWILAETVNERPGRAASLSREDMNYIQTLVTGLGASTNEIRFCVRNYIALRQATLQKVGCIGSGNRTAQQIEHIVNLLTALF